jgi:hypothetical protein
MNYLASILGFFRKSHHASQREQMKDLDFYPAGMRHLFLKGENCDQLMGSNGPFGQSMTNPIPVNGWFGTLKYFWRLQTPFNKGLYFHRIGKARSQVSQTIDVYETVSADRKIWDILYFDMFHPRRSNLAPEGYRLRPYDKVIDSVQFAFGTNTRLANFPHDLPEVLDNNPEMSRFAKVCSKNISMNDFSKPDYHAEKLALLQGDAQFVQELSKPRLSRRQVLEENLIRLKADLKQSEDHLALALKKSRV